MTTRNAIQKMAAAIFTVLLLSYAAPVAGQTTYTLGTWTVTTKQAKGVARLFNKMNSDLALAAISNGTIINAGGSGYAVGNVLTIADSGTTTTAMSFTVTAIGANGAVSGVSLLNAGDYASHQAAANHSTTVAPAGGTGCVLRVNFYSDVANMVVRNGGILDSAATSYSAQFNQELQAALAAAVLTATDTQLTNAAAALGVALPK